MPATGRRFDGVHTVQMLGHSMAATVLPEGAQVVYTFGFE